MSERPHDTVQEWMQVVDACYPHADAEAWDQVGLMVGDPADQVRRVLLTLDVTPAVVDEAADVDADLVIAHHPLLFQPLERLTPETAPGRVALQAARQGIAVAAAHTNVDVAVGGTSDPVVSLLGLRDVEPLRPIAPAGGSEVKLVVFVPSEHTHELLTALSGAGAGLIGEYDQCSFRVAGTGTFRPSAQADPHLGERERLNEVAEDRLEVVVSRSRLPTVVTALWEAHPYEEVAYDVYPLVSAGRERLRKGLGRVGDLPQPMPLRAIAEQLAVGLPAPHLRVAGDLDAPMSRVAVCGGAGDALIDGAGAAGADLFVTGDLRHHPALDALTCGLAVIDAGHYATEAAALGAVGELLEATARERGLRAGLVASRVRTEPWADWWPPRPASADAGPVRPVPTDDR